MILIFTKKVSDWWIWPTCITWLGSDSQRAGIKCLSRRESTSRNSITMTGPRDRTFSLQDPVTRLCSVIRRVSCYNSLNNQRFSTQGMEWEAAYRLYTDNMVTYGSNSPVSVFQTHWSGYFSPNRVFTIMPSVYGRVVGKNTQSLAISNFVGGNVPGRYMEQQIPFTGINHIEISPDAILAGMLGVRAKELTRISIS